MSKRHDLKAEIEAKKGWHIRARRKFKACVRLVIANLYWMQDVGDEELGEDVKRNIALLLKKKKDKKSLITLYEKTILCKPAEDRTPEEQYHLFKAIGGLKCFRKYTTDVKMQLTGVCYFVYYPPNRVIVKQDRPGDSLYFIMSGSVNVSITKMDPIFREEVTEVVGTMEAGEMFGEVSLLHNIPRTATITTTTHCEMIILQKKEFDTVLKKSVQAVWDQILENMALFRYFDSFNEVARRECCIYSSIKTYRMHDIVYGTGDFSDRFVHFVISGKCIVVERLPVVETVAHGRKRYKLFDRAAYREELKTKSLAAMQNLTANTSTMIENLPGRPTRPSVSMKVTNTTSNIVQNFDIKSTISGISEYSNVAKRIESKPSKIHKASRVPRASRASQSIKITRKTHEEQLEDLKRLLGMFQEDTSGDDIPLPPYVKTIFMQVCVFTELACFGLGENMKYRQIIAATDYVDCLLIPKFWIWQKNEGNIWSQVLQYLNRKIPNTEEVFKMFVENRNWRTYKQCLVKSIVRNPPCNNINNVPYSIRLREDLFEEGQCGYY